MCGKMDSIPILIVHGYFSANRIGPQRLFFDTSHALADKSFDVYRFDLSGMGESDGDIQDIRFSDHAMDVYEMLKFVRERNNNKKVVVIAHCMGSSLTLSNIIEHPDWFREVIFLAPFYTTQEIISNFFTKEALNQLVEENYTYRNGLYAHASFFNESLKDDFINNIVNTPVIINTIIPTRDQFIPLDSNLAVFEKAPKVILKMIYGADHNFLKHKSEIIDTILELLNDENYKQ